MKPFLFFILLSCHLHATIFFSPEMCKSHLKTYSDKEKEAIEQDLKVVKSVCFPKVASSKACYIATSGSPGSRKSTILERYLSANDLLDKVAYLDPDQRGLKFMVHTYVSQSLSLLTLSKDPSFLVSQKNAYEKWRGASNYITLTLLEEAFSEKKSIAHGTTSTGEHIASFLPKVKEAGYSTTLLLCYSEDDFRQKSIQYRNHEQKFYQSTPEDAVSKWKAFPQRMSAYFSHGDTLYLYWSKDLETKESLAAIFKDGKLEVIDAGAYTSFTQKFEKDRKLLEKESISIPPWEELLQLYFARFLKKAEN